MFERVYPARQVMRATPGPLVASLIVHAATLIVASMSVPVYLEELPPEGVLFYAPPPLRRSEPVVERLTYVDVSSAGSGEALEGAPDTFIDGSALNSGRGGSDVQEGEGGGGFAGVAELPRIDLDSIYFPDEVDNPAAYDPRSAAPAYPDSLQGAGIEGSVIVQFVVDTNGRAAVATLEIVGSTHPKFAESVRDAVPRMLFRPAEITGVKIRQLVQQTFTFRLPGPAAAARDSASARTPASVPPPS